MAEDCLWHDAEVATPAINVCSTSLNCHSIRSNSFVMVVSKPCGRHLWKASRRFGDVSV